MDTQNIKVLNYGGFIAISTRNGSRGLGASENGVPTFEYMSMNDIEYLNSISPVFRTGRLEFEENVREEVYEKLAIPDWRTRCIFERDIQGMILHPTPEIMRRIVDVADVQTIERFRGHMTVLVNNGYDVSVKVQDVINERYREINQGIRKSRMAITETPENNASQEVEAMKRELEQLKAMVNAKAEEPEKKPAAKKPAAKKAPVKKKPAAK